MDGNVLMQKEIEKWFSGSTNTEIFMVGSGSGEDPEATGIYSIQISRE